MNTIYMIVALISLGEWLYRAYTNRKRLWHWLSNKFKIQRTTSNRLFIVGYSYHPLLNLYVMTPGIAFRPYKLNCCGNNIDDATRKARDLRSDIKILEKEANLHGVQTVCEIAIIEGCLDDWRIIEAATWERACSETMAETTVFDYIPKFTKKTKLNKIVYAQSLLKKHENMQNSPRIKDEIYDLSQMVMKLFMDYYQRPDNYHTDGRAFMEIIAILEGLAKATREFQVHVSTLNGDDEIEFLDELAETIYNHMFGILKEASSKLVEYDEKGIVSPLEDVILDIRAKNSLKDFQDIFSKKLDRIKLFSHCPESDEEFKYQIRSWIEKIAPMIVNEQTDNKPGFDAVIAKSIYYCLMTMLYGDQFVKIKLIQEIDSMSTEISELLVNTMKEVGFKITKNKH